MSREDGLVDPGHTYTVTAEDESFHDPGTHPLYSESGWFSFAVPEREMGGFVYFWHRPNMGLSIGGIGLYDPTGFNPYDCLYYDWGTLEPMPKGCDMFDFSLSNGLTVECIEPLEQYRVVYDAPTCRLDLTYTTVAAPHGITYPSGGEQWGAAHFDQVGHSEGEITVRGETITIPHDYYGLRDRSWGPRRPTSTPRGGYPYCFRDPDNGFFFKAISDLPPDRDPVLGTTERAIWGFRIRDGVKYDLVRGTRRCVERHPDGRALRTIVTGVDESGEEFSAEGRHKAWLAFSQGYTLSWYLHTEWDLDGAAVWGEDHDFFPQQQARAFIRSRRGTAR